MQLRELYSAGAVIASGGLYRAGAVIASGGLHRAGSAVVAGSGLVAQGRVGSSWIGYQTHVFYFGRWILKHQSTREVPL